MSKVVQPYLRGVGSIKNELSNSIRKILRDKWPEVLKILTEEQLGLGIDSKGKLIGRYSKATDAIASSSVSIALGESPRKDKIAGQPYNFEWTGGTFDEMFLTFDSKDTYTLFSYDAKATFLKDTYGDIFDFTEAHNQRINYEIIAPELDRMLTEKLNLL